MNSIMTTLTGISVLGLGAASSSAAAQSPDPAALGTAAPNKIASADTTQASTDTQASSNAGEVAVGEIVVTAQKRAENLQKVPISVAAISSETIEDLHATNLQNLQGSVPNVQINNFTTTPTTAVYTIRGIGIIEPDPYAGNTVSIVVDGIPQYFSMGALADIYDVARIEVLRGPQGTLFGANTTGGVVNIINNQPKHEFGGKIDVGYGNYNHIQAAGVLNVPFNDQLAGRFVISHDQRDGYITNVVDGRDLGRRNVTLFRGALKYDPGKNFDVTLSGEYDRTRNGSPVVVQGAVPGEVVFIPEGFRNMYPSPCLPILTGHRCKAPDKYLAGQNRGPTFNGQVVDPIKDSEKMDTYSGTLTINIRDTGIGDITTITGYKHFHNINYTDQGGGSVWLVDTRRQTRGWQFSQEIRTAFDVTKSIKVQLGAFYLKDHYNHQSDLRLDFSGPIFYDFATNTVTKTFPGIHVRNLEDQDNYSISGFAQTYIDLTDKLRLQAGIRYTHEQTKMLASAANSWAMKTGVTTFEGTEPDGTPNFSFGTVAPPRGVKSWNNVGWKLGLDYHITDDLMVYGYWARGFKSGGFTGRIAIAQDIGPYDPEHVDTFEVGFKADLFDRRLRWNSALFYTNYRDMQLAVIGFAVDPKTGQQLQTNSIINAASSHIKGFETELTAVPVRGLTLNASLAYLDAKYQKFLFRLPSGAVLDLKGERLQNAPKWTGSVSATWEFPVGNMTGRIRGQYSYQSEKLLSNILDTPRSRVQPQHIVNANADLMINDKITVGVWATNLFDKRYINAANDFPGLLGPVNYAPPRMYGVSARYEF
jgi:iron complex outermembrane recepter protein